MRVLIIAIAIATLAGCKDRPAVAPPPPTIVKVPVTTPCVDGDRPVLVAALKAEYGIDVWNAMSVRQKSALVVAKGLERQSYGDRIAAATAGCK